VEIDFKTTLVTTLNQTCRGTAAVLDHQEHVLPASHSSPALCGFLKEVCGERVLYWIKRQRTKKEGSGKRKRERRERKWEEKMSADKVNKLGITVTIFRPNDIKWKTREGRRRRRRRRKKKKEKERRRRRRKKKKKKKKKKEEKKKKKLTKPTESNEIFSCNHSHTSSPTLQRYIFGVCRSFH